MANGHGSKFDKWMSNGLISTMAWFLVLIIYVVFRANDIEDPALGQAFLVLTGAWVGVLTLAQGKKQAKVEDTATEAKERAVEADRKIDKLTERADESEDRETGWSKHRDHTEDEP